MDFLFFICIYVFGFEHAVTRNAYNHMLIWWSSDSVQIYIYISWLNLFSFDNCNNFVLVTLYQNTIRVLWVVLLMGLNEKWKKSKMGWKEEMVWEKKEGLKWDWFELFEIEGWKGGIIILFGDLDFKKGIVCRDHNKGEERGIEEWNHVIWGMKR